jgi:hypothetical protein
MNNINYYGEMLFVNTLGFHPDEGKNLHSKFFEFETPQQVKYIYKDLDFHINGYIIVSTIGLKTTNPVTFYIYFDAKIAQIVLCAAVNGLSNIKHMKQFIDHLAKLFCANRPPYSFYMGNYRAIVSREKSECKILVPKNYARKRLKYEMLSQTEGLLSLDSYDWKKDGNGKRQIPEVVREIRLILDKKDAKRTLIEVNTSSLAFCEYLVNIAENHNKYILKRLQRKSKSNSIN